MELRKPFVTLTPILPKNGKVKNYFTPFYLAKYLYQMMLFEFWLLLLLADFLIEK